MTTEADVRAFWFGALDAEGRVEDRARRRWFQGGDAFDRAIRERFEEDVRAALEGRLETWAATPHGRLALILVLDQLPRNLFRGRAEAFSGDRRARRHAHEMVETGEDRTLLPIERYFVYMPFMHAEDLAAQARGVELFTSLAGSGPEDMEPVFASGIDYAERHLRCVERFGCFPARNAALGRETTAEQEAFLREHPAGF